MERDPLDIAWAAGLFEGEGCLTLGQERRGKRYVGARLGTTDHDIVERFARIVGFGTINRKRPPSTPEHWKTVWEWSTQSAPGVREVIDLFWDYLGERRRERADEVYQHSLDIQPHNGDRDHCINGHAYTPENTISEKRGHKTVRRCRTCRRADARRWEAKKRAA